MTGEVNLGVTLSRTLIPTLPHGYLSRKHLFPLIDNQAPGTTLVIAPAGYGKTSLISEWAQSRGSDVIWLTVANGDTLNEMSAMMITATRNVIPGFGAWFERDQPLRPTEVVRRWGNELLESRREFVFVLDVIRNESNEDIEIANQLLEQFPSNVHFIAMRRDEIDSIYATCSSRGPLKVITAADLRFSDAEVEKLAANSKIVLTPESKKSILAANGWPSATSLLLAHIQVRGEAVDIEQLMASSVEPIRALALLVLEGTDKDVVKTCENLSVLQAFNLDIAKFLLGEEFSFELINRIALDGEIFSHSRDPQFGYIFTPMIREVLLENLRKRDSDKVALHKKLISYFENLGQPSLALEQAFYAGDQTKVGELFPDAARLKQARGQGGDLIRWSVFAGDNTTDGELKRATVEIAGNLANLDFGAANSLCARVLLLSQESESVEFYAQFVAGAHSYSHLTLGKNEDLEESVIQSKSGEPGCYLGVDDQINILRLLAAKSYLHDDNDRVKLIYETMESLAKKTSLRSSHTFLRSVEAMLLHQQGEYRRAYEIATLVHQDSRSNTYVGNHGPLDVMYIQARTLVEFSRIHEAMDLFEQVRNLAFQWKQWHWYIACDNHIIQALCLRNQEKEALERIRLSRELVASLEPTNELWSMVDAHEMYVRRRLKDFERLEVLVSRAKDSRFTQQMKMVIDEHRGRKVLHQDAKNLPSHTPREAIWKHLMIASINIDSEKIALPEMREAMKIGAMVGAKETFLRQRDEMGNLVIKVANESPTVYNEDLASAMADRMNERGSAMTNEKTALTKRELEILRQLSTGRTLTVIAGELHISQNTMKTHLKNLYKKIGAEGRHDAVDKAKATFLL